MEVLNLAEKQIKSKSLNPIESAFFKEYFRLFNSNVSFEKDTKQLMQAYSTQEVSKSVSFLKTLSEEILYQINDILNRDVVLDIITFFGDCSYDGHAILIDGKPYIFFDLNAVLPRLDFYNFKAFITHEMIHGVHYILNPAFYRGNYHTVEEKYLKLLFAEGIATYLSSVISKEKIEDAYWFGYLKTNQVSKWVRNCEKMKNDIGNNLQQAINLGKLDKPFYNRLFGIDDFEMVTSYRTGYYYGSEIVKYFLEEKNINDALLLDYKGAKKLISGYFYGISF
ncbi:DUF2268 domain-containing putative Zn-dependent protease [Salinicoccus sp. CNSTN-B1]